MRPWTDAGFFAGEVAEMSRPLRSLLSWLWRGDSLPLANDGTCHACGHRHGPRFGHFVCEACGRWVSDNDLGRNIQNMSFQRWVVAVAGGLLLAGGMTGLALLVDPYWPYLLEE